MSSVLKALKKAEKEKAKVSAPFIYSLKRTKTKKLSYNFIRSGLFTVLALSFLCSLLYWYNFNNKKIRKEKRTGDSIYFPQKNSEKKPIEFPNKPASVEKNPSKSESTISVRVNQTQTTKKDPESVKAVDIEDKNIPTTQPKQEVEPEKEILTEPEPEPKFKNEPADTIVTPKASKPNIELNMISWTHDPNERIAIINDSPMKEGEVKDGITVLKINIKDVRIKQNNVEKVLKFKKSEDSDL